MNVSSKKCLTSVPREHKPFCQLSRLDDFAINAIVNLFVHEGLKIPEAYSKASRISKMELFANLFYDYKLLLLPQNVLILDVRLGSEYVSASFFPGTFYILLGKEVSQGKIGIIKE